MLTSLEIQEIRKWKEIRKNHRHNSNCLYKLLCTLFHYLRSELDRERFKHNEIHFENKILKIKYDIFQKHYAIKIQF